MSFSIPVPITPTQTRKTTPYHLSREPMFYQEAYLASETYIRQIGAALKRDHGFREVDENDVAVLYPFAVQPQDEPLLLNLRSTDKDKHIIQLPQALSSLLSAPSAPSHARLRTFATLLTPTACHITESTLSLAPLRDLISFLQCLLPSGSALALSPLPSSVTQSVGRHATEDEEDEEEQQEKAVISRIDTWRQTTTTITPVLENENENENEHENEVNIDESVRSRSHTPCPRWLEKNEDILRETVGCSYYRHLKELAEEVSVAVG